MGLILERSIWFIPNGIWSGHPGRGGRLVSVTILTHQAEQKMSDTDRE